MRYAVVRTVLEALYFSGAHKLMQPYVGGVGAIIMLHHVRPARSDEFQPNRLLEITPDFLASVLQRLRQSGFEFVSLDEAHRRLVDGDFRQRFVVMTLDDGYRDNKEWAYPIFTQYNVPFAIYVPTSFPDRLGQLWWVALEQVIARHDSIMQDIDGRTCQVICRTAREKYRAYDQLYWWLRSQSSEAAMLAIVRDLAARYDVDLAAICDAECMSWDELRTLAADPRVTIGAHTVNHVTLSRASPALVRSELELGRAAIEQALGQPPRHLAYPYGDGSAVGAREYAIAAELGYVTGVTTEAGVLFPEHRDHLTALPRIPINGEFQRGRYVEVMVTGASAALSRGLRRVAATCGMTLDRTASDQCGRVSTRTGRRVLRSGV